jgi:hypothetical protein
MTNESPIAYFVDFSIQDIPSIAYIAGETGGIIFTTAEATAEWVRAEHPSLNVRCIPDVAAIRKKMREQRIRVIVYPDYHLRYFRELEDVKHVQVFHGISDKVYDYQREVLEYDLFLIPGLESYRRYERKGLLKKGTGCLVGCPKMDRVFRGELRRDELLLKLGLSPENRTVLYAPTWVDSALNSSWRKFRSAFVKGKPPSLNLIVKLHPNLRKYREQEVDDFGAALGRLPNTRLYDRLPDIVPLLGASDLMVSDVSSVTREYLAFRRPFVFLSNKPVWMWKRRKTVLWECGEVVLRPSRVWNAIERTLAAPERRMDRIQAHFEKTFYKPDGGASRRAAEAIFGLIES